MKTPKPILLLCLLVMELTLSAQIQWCHNQPCKMRCINLNNGNISWSRRINFSENGCNLSRLAISNNTSGFDTSTNSTNYYGRGVEDKVLTEVATEEIEKVELTTKLIVYPNPVQNQLNISNINPEEYDRVTVYNMQGALLQQQKTSTSIIRMDISNLTDGVYLLILRSSFTLKEKTIKFVVRK